MRLISSLVFISITLCVGLSCRKPQSVEETNPKGSTTQRLSYGDSVLYLKSNDLTYSPLSGKTGVYTAFPDNLKIDRTTGAITLGIKGNDGESQTGMWYKIKYQSGNEADSTLLLISGITYVDKLCYFSANDSIVSPIYNADPDKPVPSAVFSCKDKTLAIDPSTGQINLKKTMQQGFFASKSWQTATIEYTINDNSKNAPNQIDIVLYYYHTLNDVPKQVSDIMQAHQSMTLGMRIAPIPSTTGTLNESLPSELSLSKPRPPCVIIVGN